MSSETINIRLSNTESTQKFGRSLVHSLHSRPLTILLNGPVGAGKTTLLQAFAEELGVEERLTSPTFALEQRYPLKNGEEFLHLDLYRLSPEQAAEALMASEEFDGVRCIEWAEKMPDSRWTEPHIRIDLDEEGEGRVCRVTFADIRIPDEEFVRHWRKNVMLQEHIIAHTEAVAHVCDVLAKDLVRQGRAVRPLALHRTGQLHDLLRFLNFSAKAAPEQAGVTPEQQAVWDGWKATHGLKHETGCAQFMKEQGYPELGEIIRPHGLSSGFPENPTVEQLLLYYADKRAAGDRLVTVQERFDDFMRRYGKDPESPTMKAWREMTDMIEKHLFPDGPPAL